MPTLNEVKYSALLNSTGAAPPVTINELEILWLVSKGRVGTLNEMWLEQFAAAGFTGKFNGAASAWLAAFGYVGTLNEMWYQFWTDGGTVNPNLVVNGDFATDTDWAKGLGWSISGGEACCDGAQASASDLLQSPTLVVGVTYRLRYTIRNHVAGSIRPVVGGVNGTATTGNGQLVEDFTAVATGSLVLKADADFIGCVDDVSLRETDIASFSATIGGNSPNFGTGSQFTTPAGLPTPTTFMGLEIAYVGSFGEFFWNARFGAAGNEQLAGVDILRVKMGDTTVVDLSWNQAQLRYQGNSAGGESLWTILGDDVGQTVQLLLQDVTSP